MNRQIKFVLSDLHLGAGFAAEGNSLEDFHSDDVFHSLIERWIRESETKQADVELIFAGDVFEFLQVPALPAGELFDPTKDYPINLYIDSSQKGSEAKLQTIIAGHPTFFQALQSFLTPNSPRRTITFIKGNHDVNLHWPGVQHHIRKALAAEGEDRGACVRFAERRISRQGLYIEHGHQYTERVNRWPDFEEPHDLSAPDQLYLPPGSRFVCRFFNALERELFWLDGVKPLTALIWYLFALDTPLAIRALGILLKETPRLVWDALPIRPSLSTILEAQDHVNGVVSDEEYTQQLDHDLHKRSTFLTALESVLSLYDLSATAELMPQLSFQDHATVPRALRSQRAQQETLAKVAQAKFDQEDAHVVVFGHTHAPCTQEIAQGRTYLNCGTWTWRQDFDGENINTWRDLFKHPERYSQDRHCTYVRIDYGADGVPAAELREVEPRIERRRPAWKRLLRWLLRH